MPRHLSKSEGSVVKGVLVGVSAVLLLVGCSGGDEGGAQGQGGTPPPAVVVEQPEVRDVRVQQDYAGRARGAREFRLPSGAL